MVSCAPVFVFRCNISVICFAVVRKLTITVLFSLYCQTLWPKWLNFFRSLQNRFGPWPRKKQLRRICASPLAMMRSGTQ